MTFRQNNKRKSTAREESISTAREETILPLLKYSCNCMVCKGKEVDGRTQKNYTNNDLRWKSKKKRKLQIEKIEARKYNSKGK